MAEIKLFEGHVESIKELRKQLADLKDAYAALASEETKDTDKMAAQLNEVAKAQDLLNDVMGNTKNAVSEADRALAQNYNTMQIGDKTVNQLRADLKMLTAVLNDTKPGPGWDELNQKVLQVNNALKGLEQSHGDFRRSVGSYAKIFDNFEQGANEVKKAGNDIQGALGAITGAMALTKDEQDELNGALSQFRGALQVINGAKGLAGLLKNLKGWLTSTKAQTTAQKAQNAGINGFTAATRAATVAEGEATVATSIWSAVLNALPFVAIATAIGVLITHFEDIVDWCKKALQWLGVFKKSEDDVKGSTDKLTKAFDEQNEKLADEQKLAKARGVSNKVLLQQQKELLEQQLKDVQAKKADIEARIAQLKADSAWVRFWKRENKQIKEAQAELEEINNVITELTKGIKDINIDIQVEDIMAGQNAANNRAKALETQNAELKKAQEKANSEIEKINEARDRTEIEKINDKYKKIREILKEGYDSEIKLAGDNAAEKTKIDAKYTEARIELAKQENVEIERAYRNMLVQQETMSQRYAEFTDQMKVNVYAYRRLIDNIFGNGENYLPSDAEWEEITGEIGKLEKAFKTTLENVKKISKEDFDELAGMTNEFMLQLYDEMLQDEDKFIKQYGQPFSEALGILSRNLMEQGQLISQRTALDLRLMREQVEKDLASGDWVSLKESLYEVMGLKGNDVQINDRIDKFVKDVKKQYVDAIMSGDNPLAMNGTFYQWLNEGLKDAILTASLNVQNLREQLSQMVPGTDEYIAKVEEMKQAEMELHEARMAQWESWNQVAGKYLETYGKATENILGNIAGYWENNIRLKDQDIKKQLEQGKITQAEYDRQHKRNDQAFKQMKKLQIATAIISTAAAVVQALADPTVPSYYVKLANAIAAGLAGATQIATIKAQELDTSGGGGVSAPQLVDRSPMVQTVGMNPNDYAAAQAENPIKVYVTDHDIEEGLNRSRARVSETTF